MWLLVYAMFLPLYRSAAHCVYHTKLFFARLIHSGNVSASSIVCGGVSQSLKRAV